MLFYVLSKEREREKESEIGQGREKDRESEREKWLIKVSRAVHFFGSFSAFLACFACQLGQCAALA